MLLITFVCETKQASKLIKLTTHLLIIVISTEIAFENKIKIIYKVFHLIHHRALQHKPSFNIYIMVS